ncbi:methyltransferase domain-containing protein [Aggregatimonas sangjinii]|uniref:methyltransferase domain-containing protein n=1 Tax=Aggregatimonas sangjinii TaxID=2583587 RepID=UPI0015861306|nr:methyltransferase domain-containing protein [Aggregatimonas sangjinii]
MNEESPYILGTDNQELFRLGVQHQVWAEEAQRGWRLANFKAGQTFLDLGCGPGYCTKELAFLAGSEGKVIGIDKSEGYIQFLKRVADTYHLNIEAIAADFDDMALRPNSIDGMYCRWALAWVPNPKEILAKVQEALKPKGKMVIHEYYDWSLLQTEPYKKSLAKGIAMALKSFKDSDMEIDIGRQLPYVLDDMGMKILSVRPMSKIATMDNGVWQWPQTFFQSYLPRLVVQDYLTPKEVDRALSELKELEGIKGASICTCLMVEIIAEKQ